MQQVAKTPALHVRALADETERETYFQMIARIFPSQAEVEPIAAIRRRLVMEAPRFQPDQVRGAFLNGQLVGGYMQWPRQLCLENTWLSTGCISSVCTHPDFRQRGIALALMRDALTFGKKQGHNLLLLHGIPDFYHRLDFIDVCEDLPTCTFTREVISAQPVPSHTVRLATHADTPTILRLYREQHTSSPVSFARSRTLAEQEHMLFNWFDPGVAPLVTLNPRGEIEGYLMLARHNERSVAYEAAARTWSAALALLHHHHTLLERDAEPTETLKWPIPPLTPLAYLLADHLPLKLSAYSRPNNGWMARPLNLARLLELCQPLLQARWQTGSMPWAGAFLLDIAEENWRVELATSGAVALTPSLGTLSADFPTVRLTIQAFTQLLFGFRPIAYLAQQPGTEIAQHLHSTLDILFPARSAWIAVSDFF